MVLEKSIEARARAYCKKQGWVLLKLYGIGFPDRVLLRPSRVTFIEFKKPGGRVSAVQKAAHSLLRSLGHEVHTVWSYEEFLRAVSTP